MHILLLGGSNTGIWEGWAHHFVILAQRNLGANVSNGFLGAAGSLYGLFQLLKREREGEQPPDLIVLEYTLNDIILVGGNILSKVLLYDTLREIAEFCWRRNITLQFLCLEPPNNSNNPVKKIYSQIAKQNSLPRPLFQDEALGRRIADTDYLDPFHLNSSSSFIVAEALLLRVTTLRKAVENLKVSSKSPAFEYIDASQARTSGQSFHTKLEMTVLKGALVEMNRPGATIWPATGRLVGIIFRSRPTSGWYKLTVDHVHRRENACVASLSVLPEVIAMQYPSIWTRARGSIEIAMLDDEAELMDLRHDLSPMEISPTSPFGEQELAIHGLILWHGPFGLARLIEPFDFWLRLIRRGMLLA